MFLKSRFIYLISVLSFFIQFQSILFSQSTGKQTDCDSILLRIEKSTDENGHINLYQQLMQCQLYKKEYNNAINSGDNALKIAINQNKQEKQAEILNQIASIYDSAAQINSAVKFYIRAASMYEKNLQSEKNAGIYVSIGNLYNRIEAYDKASDYFLKAFQFVDGTKKSDLLISILKKLGKSYKNSKNYQKSIDTYQKLNSVYKEKNNWLGSIQSLHEIGECYKELANYAKSIETYQQIYSIYKNLSDLIGMSNTMNNLGYYYLKLKDNKNALTSFLTVLTVDEQTKPSENERIPVYTNISVCYQNMGDYENSIKYILKALQIREIQKNNREIARLNNLIAMIYFKKGDLYNAEIYSSRSIVAAQQVNAKDVLQNCYQTYSAILQQGNESDKALEYYQKYLSLRDSLLLEQRWKDQKQSQEQFEVEKTDKEIKLSVADEQVKDLTIRQLSLEKEKNEKQVELLKSDKALKESMLKQQELEKERALQELALVNQQREAEKRDNELKSLQKEKELQDIRLKQKELEEKERKRTIELLEREKKVQTLELENQKKTQRFMHWVGILFITIFVLILIGFIITKKKNRRLAQQKQEIQEKNADLAQKNEEINAQKDYLEQANEEIQIKNIDLAQKNEEINAQKDYLEQANSEILAKNEEITNQKEIIEKKNEDIMSSITYASRIQNAILPPDELLNECLSEHFVLFKPRNIVSGDFYWMKQLNNTLYIAAADCTGHGVPGAFMSMLGISFLNEIVNIESITQANEILNELRNRVKSSLHQTGKEGEAKDGMDISLIIINQENFKMQYAGAYNPVYIIRNHELIQLKADVMPIGIYLKEKESFSNTEIELKNDDCIYLFSDGYNDQFGGKNDEKFKSKRLKELLLQIHNQPMLKQKEIIESTHNQWKGNREQVDDILVIGFRMNN